MNEFQEWSQTAQQVKKKPCLNIWRYFTFKFLIGIPAFRSQMQMSSNNNMCLLHVSELSKNELSPSFTPLASESVCTNMQMWKSAIFDAPVALWLPTFAHFVSWPVLQNVQDQAEGNSGEF